MLLNSTLYLSCKCSTLYKSCFYSVEGRGSGLSVHRADFYHPEEDSQAKSGWGSGRSEFRGWAANGSSVEIERTGRTCAGSFHDVEINHGGGDVGVTQKTLNGPDVGPGFK